MKSNLGQTQSNQNYEVIKLSFSLIGVSSGDIVGGGDNSPGVKLFLTSFLKISTKSKKIESVAIDSVNV